MKKLIEKIRIFIQDTIAELYKCTWPGKDELFRSTIIVIVTIAITGIFITCMDTIIRYATTFIMT